MDCAERIKDLEDLAHQLDRRFTALTKIIAMQKAHIQLLVKRASATDVIVDGMHDSFILSPPMDRTGMIWENLINWFENIETKLDGQSYVIQRLLADMPDSKRSVNQVAERVEELDFSSHYTQPATRNWSPSLRLEDTE